MRRSLVALAVALGFAAAPAAAAAADLTTLVSPLSGTLGSGFPFVGATRPFGMVQLGADTGMPGGEDPVTYVGYAYQDPMIRGFSLTHFEGAGIHIGGDLPFMATTGAVDSTDPAQYGSPFSHAAEDARPGYYAVDLARYQTRAELTATDRTGLMRFTFPATSQANVLVNAAQSIGGTHPAAIRVVGDRELEGWARSDVGYTVYFAARFDRAFASFGTWDGAGGTPAPGGRSGSGGGYVTFDAATQHAVTVRVGISYVDATGARANLDAEAPPKRSFDAVRQAAHDAWDARLHDAEVEGGDPGRRQTFYTNLYRALQMPSLFEDADGRYLGFDGAVRTVPAGTHHYTNLSLWDTYRTQTPLLALLEPRVARDVALSLLDDADQNHGVVPRWVQANRDRGIMGGDSGTATLADLVASGVLDRAGAIRAYATLLRQATTLPGVWPREHLGGYLARGYVATEESGIGAPLTQEYATDDAALAALAHRLGTPEEAAALERRTGFWRNLMDPSSHFIRPRSADGSWANPTSAGPVATWRPELQDGYQEATAWQALWAEPHDVAGLADAIGGRQAALDRLDQFFSTALQHPASPAVPSAQQYASFFGVYYIGDQYTPANETDLWAPWYYDWLGQPWKTQQVVRAAMSVYNPRPDGLPGNDDAGTMSAWYVLAALGLYHAAPGSSSWQLSSPAFAGAVLRSGRRQVVLDAPGASAATPFVQAATLNGRPLDRTYLTTCELFSGARLAYTLGATHDTGWATSPASAPPSLSDPAPRGPACDATALRR